MKIITFYLPQYHRIKENDEWWGEGFTEWTNVKRTKPLYKNQVQPKVPLDGNYYDLMNRETVEWQTNLMNKYGVYGFCYFHYWFNGKKLLEKPAENLLEWKDIEQNFCFAWANCTWARTWSAAKNFTNWVINDTEDNGGRGVLVEQTYGDKKDWIEHYNYLRDFFVDERYIKVGNSPMFLIYELDDIECANEMFDTWNELARLDGFDGIHLVSINQYNKEIDQIKAVAKYGYYSKYDKRFLRRIYNRFVDLFHLPFESKPVIINYDKVWKGLIAEKYDTDVLTYPGGVVTYDETPRKGKNGVYMEGATPEKFGRYLKKQLKKAREECGTEYLFLDAWNEWGEGNYLEPDEENGYGYLEALKDALCDACR